MDHDAPSLSLGMPVYNGERFLTEALDSVLCQSYGDFELVISDNGSTDGTEQICRDYASRDSRILYSRNAENVGATANYNTVFQRARGKYFKWTSSNDICKPSFLEKCVAVLDAQEDVVLCCPRTRLFDSDSGSESDCNDNLHLLEHDPYKRFTAVMERLSLNNVMNGIVRSDAMRRTELIPDILAGDKILIAELALMGKFVEIPEYLFYRRMDKVSATRLKNADEVLKHFDPKARKPMLFQNWKGLFLYFRAISRAEIELQTKLRIYHYLGRVARWTRGKLARDVVEGAKWHLGSR